MEFCAARCQLKRLGKYEIIGELGRGAMGIVYQARDPIISRKVALKTITTNIANDLNLLQRFYREAQSAGGLQHPNIITIYDMGEEGGLPYIAMELVEGQNLEQVISCAQDLPLSLKLGYGVQACRSAGLCSQTRHRPPRHQTRQRDGQRGRRCEGGGFRHRASHGGFADSNWDVNWHVCLHVSGSIQRGARTSGPTSGPSACCSMNW